MYMQVLPITRADQHTQLTSMPKPKLTLYLDQVSPFAYFAFHIIRVSCFLFSISTSKAGNYNDVQALLYQTPSLERYRKYSGPG